KELRVELERHNRLYYNQAAPEVSDGEYDALFRELVAIEEAHPELVTPQSPTQRVGAALPDGESFEKVAHVEPMISIESIFSEDGVREFEKGVLRFLALENGDDLRWLVEPKFDGVSAALIYEHGQLVRCLTRGDGQMGEDVTQNLRTVRNIPLELDASKRSVPDLLEVRGEVLIALARFEAFNAERAKAGLDTFANPRNTTSGAMRRNDPAEVARYPLEFHAYAAPRCSEHEFASQSDLNEALTEWGIPFSGYGKAVLGLDACFEYHRELESGRDNLPFEVDGIVAKLDDLALRARLGKTARAHRWQYAQKFAPREATTILRAIEISVGTNGRLTPRAHVDAVEVGGVTVRHTTLHNAEHVESLGLKVGDRVFLHRAGDVIPQISSVAKPAKGKYAEAFTAPTHCPSCGSESVQEGKYWRCPNTYNCTPQLIGRTSVMAGRRGFEIDRIGEKQIAQLYDAGLMATPADLFHLDRDPAKREALLELERWGAKSVDNLFAQIEDRRKVPFDRLLVALCIPEVGSSTAKLLAHRFDSLDDLREAQEEDLLVIDGIGGEVAGEIMGWFAREENQQLIARLLEGGVEPVHTAAPSQDGAFAGKVIVFTGTLERMSRAEAKHSVESQGGKVASSVSGKTNFLIVGGKPGSKAKKAEALGVEVLLEEAFLERLGSR
ncbi:UNVERIFIED_CONTAM: hypothetical protein GTU68_042805, partial [Idotea baltica]|nr:hypothetical protein [Idotea baltica]